MMRTRRSVLLGAAGLMALPALARVGSPGKRLIVVLAAGGWDVTYCLDPKLGRAGVDGPELDEDPHDPDDREAVRTFADLPVVVNDRKRAAVTAFFEAHAAQTVVVNGIFTAAVSHEAGLVRLLTGTGDLQAPDLGAVVGRRLGEDLPLGYVDLSGYAMPGPYTTTTGRLGRGGQLKLLLEPHRLQAPAGAGFTYPTWSPSPSDRQALEAYLHGRDALSLDPAARPLLDDLLESRLRARRLREQVTGRLDALRVGDAGTLSSDGKTAVELLRAGACQAVLLESREHWDTHDTNAQQHRSWSGLFHGLKQLIDGLQRHALLDDTLVVVLSEMTRTPVRNAHAGKDHWPCTSALVIGGGVRGGRVLGGTDDALHAQPVDLDSGVVHPAGGLLRYDNLAAGLLELLDIDPAAYIGARPLRGF